MRSCDTITHGRDTEHRTNIMITMRNRIVRDDIDADFRADFTGLFIADWLHHPPLFHSNPEGCAVRDPGGATRPEPKTPKLARHDQ